MRSTALIVVIAAIAALLTLYIAAYYRMGYRFDHKIQILPDETVVPINVTQRTYDYRWAVAVFEPARWIESKIRGVDVEVAGWPRLLLQPGSTGGIRQNVTSLIAANSCNRLCPNDNWRHERQPTAI